MSDASAAVLGGRTGTRAQRASVEKSFSGCTGLDTKSFMPASMQRCLSSRKALAVVAMIGAFPLPIEVAPFGLGATERAIAALAARLGLAGPMKVRRAGADPYRTDGGHYIIDASFGRIPDPEALAAGLDVIAGVMGHGLFLGIASEAVIARQNDVIRLKPAGLQR